jgi:solute carrier family 25 phosphate transporter 23/24/25/41
MAAGSGVPSQPWDGTKEWLSQPVVASFIAGGMAGAVSRTVVSPLERLKILFQIQSVGREEYKMSIGKALGKMWREEGFRGFMAGNGTNCIRIVPYSAVQFGSYNFYKRVCNAPPAPVRGDGHLLTHSSSLRTLLVRLSLRSNACRVVLSPVSLP